MKCARRPCERKATVVVTGGAIALLLCEDHGRHIVELAGDGYVTARPLQRPATRRRPA